MRMVCVVLVWPHRPLTVTSGWTPLHIAVRYNAEDIARLLIDRGGAVSQATNGYIQSLSACGATELIMCPQWSDSAALVCAVWL